MPHRRKRHDDAIKRLKGLAGSLARVVLHEIVLDVQERHGFATYRFKVREAEPMFGFVPEDATIHMRVAGVITNDLNDGYFGNVEVDVIVYRTDDWLKLGYSQSVAATLFEKVNEIRYHFTVPAPGECASVKIVEAKEYEDLGEPSEDVDIDELNRLIEASLEEGAAEG